MRLTRKSKLILAGIATIAITGGSAVAYWTTTGTGSGTATAGNTVGITVHQNPVVGVLYPGGSFLPLSGTFTSTNSGVIHIDSVTASVTGTNKPACVFGDFEITGTATGTGGLGYTVASGSSTTWNGLSIKLNNTGSNQDACKDAIVDIAYATTAS